MMGSQDEEVERNDLKECGGRDRRGGGGRGLGRRERDVVHARERLEGIWNDNVHSWSYHKPPFSFLERTT